MHHHSMLHNIVTESCINMLRIVSFIDEEMRERSLMLRMIPYVVGWILSIKAAVNAAENLR